MEKERTEGELDRQHGYDEGEKGMINTVRKDRTNRGKERRMGKGKKEGREEGYN